MYLNIWAILESPTKIHLLCSSTFACDLNKETDKQATKETRSPPKKKEEN